ncbi:AAA domain-containing protein [Novosphingobium lindaniclasticum]
MDNPPVDYSILIMTMPVHEGMRHIMTSDTQKVTKYWRNSLADAELGRGTFTQKDADDFLIVDNASLNAGRLPANLLASLFSANASPDETCAIILRPFVFASRTERGLKRGSLPEIVTPIATRMMVTRDGRLIRPVSSVVPRDILEPLHRMAFTVGTIDALDAFVTTHPLSEDCEWQDYVDHAEGLMEAVASAIEEDRRFELVPHGYVQRSDGHGSMSANVLALYDQIELDGAYGPLLTTFAGQKERRTEPCLPENSRFAERLGHSSDTYALAPAQREALAHLTASQDGEVLAVNGPPGTGKTTMLLSVIATLWAKAALEQGEAPLIVATSTNNQAVTNILDAFGADYAKGAGPFAGRWLPALRSFGSYFPSKRRESEAAKTYQIAAFFDRLEEADQVEQCRLAYLDAAAKAFPHLQSLTVETVVGALHHRLTGQVQMLAAIENAWQALLQARAAVLAEMGPDPRQARAARATALEAAEAELHRTQAISNLWDRHQASEPVLHTLLGWLPSIAKRRLAAARAALASAWSGPLPEWTSLGDIASSVRAEVGQAQSAMASCIADLGRADAVIADETTALGSWASALTVLSIAPEAAISMTLGDVDEAADRLVRFPIFLTTTHYWEGRWLLDMAADPDIPAKQRKTGRIPMTTRWARRMKLTPCAVSTFYMLPRLLCASRFQDGDFLPDYLYGQIDLLIVDEAGQVTPEIAGASFALAKRALIIGDTAQIEPIWSVPSRIDVGNLRQAGLIGGDDTGPDLATFLETGRAASSGSVMRIAQHASRYHQDADLERGLMLYEHRRCFDEIVGYCNDLCYRGKLQPKRGLKSEARKSDGLPALGYLHIDGRCDSITGGSRRNALEAETIARWLADRQEELLASYPGKRLDEIVGIVTPFAGQARAITSALGRLESLAGANVTIGTINTFQGGQRPVILFSPTYSKHADGSFIDAKASMLNVAVSRAMNSFLVFGDMDCFSAAAPGSPRGRLRQRLLAHEGNRLFFDAPARPDLTHEAGLVHLTDLDAHDGFLRDVLEECRSDIHIVTPWLTDRGLQGARIVPLIEAAANSGVSVTVYTDRALNEWRGKQDKGAVESFAAAKQNLEGAGAIVVEVKDVHSKIVMADNNVYCVGSFNWLSAAREGTFVRHETSLAYRGASVSPEIETMKDSLRKRAII